MYLKRFRSTNVREALRAAHAELGPDALVLSTEVVPAAGWRGWLGVRMVELSAAAQREEPSDRRLSQTEARHLVEHAGTAGVVARLTAGGLEPDLADEIAASMSSSSRRGASLETLRAAVAETLAELPANDEAFAGIEVFVGPPGVGKTTTIAKIAAQARARSGKRLSLVSADGFRIGAVEQLRMYADIIGNPFRVARTSEDLDQALSGTRRQPVLVDTAGRPASEARDLFRVLAKRADVRTHLVIAAGTPAPVARRVFDDYAEARPSRLVLTKLDETESLSPLIGLLRMSGLPISYLGTGQRVPEDLSIATAQLLAAAVTGDTGLASARYA